MAVEIERKFLVIDDSYRAGAASEEYRQGYLCPHSGPTVRIRVAGTSGFITIKARRSGLSRDEFEYPIPLAEALEMLSRLCRPPLIEKRRYTLDYRGFTWVVDEFYGENAGLVVAEIELADEEQTFARPPWLGAEVTHDGRYANSSLYLQPYRRWRQAAG